MWASILSCGWCAALAFRHGLDWLAARRSADAIGFWLCSSLALLNGLFWALLS